MEIFDVRSIVAAVFLLGCLGCVPEQDLSSYSGSVARQPSAPADLAGGEPGVERGTLPPMDAPVAVDAPEPAAPTSAASSEETAPAVAPIAATPTAAGAAASEPAEPVEPVEPSDGAPTRGPPAVDAASCAATGGFSIAATSSCYMLGDNVFTWQDARRYCQAWGGDLVEIGSAEENAALAESIEQSVWIGASDGEEEGIFRWASGAPLGYARWSANQPNNLQGNEDCSELRPSDQRWSDVPCTGDIPRLALCESP